MSTGAQRRAQASVGTFAPPPGLLARWVARLPDRYTKRGLLRYQMWGIVASFILLLPAAVALAAGPEAATGGVTLGSILVASGAAFMAVRAYYEFKSASLKRIERRVAEAVAPHEHPELLTLRTDLTAVTQELVSLGASVARKETLVRNEFRGLHDRVEELRGDVAAGQENAGRKLDRLEAGQDAQRTAQEQTTVMVAEIFKAIVPPKSPAPEPEKGKS